MDDGLYLPIPGHLLFSHPEIFSHGFDEFLTNTTTCTHTHTCNTPSSAASLHTHTCLHAHTQLIASREDDVEQDQLRNRRKPLGNREAVRKYRQKKKAHAAFLEEEIKKLRAANQQLLRRLQGHAALEAEVARLSSLLLDVRGKVDTELGDILLHAETPPPFFDTDIQAAAVLEDCEINDSGIVSGDHGVPEAADSVDAVASFVNAAA